MIEDIIKQLVVLPGAVFSLTSMMAYGVILQDTYKDAPNLKPKERLRLTTDKFKNFYFENKGYWIPIAFTSPIYINFIAQNFF